MEHFIYTIEIDKTVVYVGRTTSIRIDQREVEHRNAFKRYLKHPKKPFKQLYVWLAQNGVKPSQIALKPIDICKTKVEAKRKEFFYMILYTYFKGVKLYQKIPGLRNY